MRKFLFICLGWFGVFTLANAQTSSEQLAQLLTDFHAMKAQFTQKSLDNTNVGNAQTTSGHMAILRPGRFLWQVEKPNQQLLVTNGKYVWMYDADLQQVTKQLLNQQTTGASPATLLSGSVKILQARFEITRLAATDDAIGFMLVPKEKNDMFAWVKLYFSANKLYAMELKDNLGQHNQFMFSDVIINPSINAQLFEFKVPAGVDVVNNL